MIPSCSYRCSFDEEEGGEDVAFSTQYSPKYRNRKWQSSASSVVAAAAAAASASPSLFYKIALCLYIIIALGSLQIVDATDTVQIPPISLGPASYLVPDCGDRG